MLILDNERIVEIAMFINGLLGNTGKILWECINTGMDYWNGGIVEWWTGSILII